MIKNVLSRISLLCILIFILGANSSCASSTSERLLIYQTESKHKELKPKINKRKAIVKTATAQIGIPYRYGGKTPAGFDCSGFTQYVMSKHGISIGANSKLQSRHVKKINLKKVQPGDLVFFSNNGKINHVGIVQSRKKGEVFIIHSTTSSGVRLDEITKSTYWRKRIKFAASVLD